MATKANEKLQEDSVWNHAADDEPLFVLRPTDRLAIFAINTWIVMADHIQQIGRLVKLPAGWNVTPEKVQSAINLRDQIVQWQGANSDKMKMPD